MKKYLLLALILPCLAHSESMQALQALYGVSSIKYNLSSDQFSADLPVANGQSYGITYSRQNYGSPLEHRIQFNSTVVQFKTPASLNPSIINLQQNTIDYKAVAHFDSIAIGGSYSFTKIDVDTTTPNILISSSESHSLGFQFEHLLFHKADFSLLLFAAADLPVIRKEIGTHTGYNQTSFTLQAGYVVKYLFTENWSILQKSEFSSIFTHFEGQGTRGTLNAKEKTENYKFLVGAEYDF